MGIFFSDYRVPVCRLFSFSTFRCYFIVTCVLSFWLESHYRILSVWSILWAPSLCSFHCGVWYSTTNYRWVCVHMCVYFSHSDRCVLISHYGFNLHFPNGEEFSCALFVTCISSLVKYTFIFFSHFLTGWFVFPLLAFETSPCILSRGLFQVCDLQTFSPVHRLPFCPLNRAFLRTKVFNFDIIQHIGFSFYVQCFDNKAKNSLLILRSQRFSTLISSKSITGLHFSLMFRIHFELIFI